MKKYFTFISILLFTACMPNEEIPEEVMPTNQNAGNHLGYVAGR